MHQRHTTAKNNYLWKGKFENKGFINDISFYDDEDDDEGEKPIIENEYLFINSELVIKREHGDIIFNNERTVKLSQQKSIVELLKEEEQIADVNNAFQKLIFVDYSPSTRSIVFDLIDVDSIDTHKKYESLDIIRESKKDISTKLYLCYKNQTEIFKEIKRQFIGVFPNIEDLKIEPLDANCSKFPRYFKDIAFIQIKEKGVNNWIHQQKISSGMYRSLLHIAELFLCAEGSVILIDEFENSLGINCIDEMTERLTTYNREIQFIITSHHPYIINNVPYDNWKLVTRKAGLVKTHNAKDFNLGRSRHEAFTQLINLDEFAEGIDG